MVNTELNSAVEYGKPPWVFRGRALYQLHLVKAEIARAFIPKELKLVEAFGYTLGGFFLANYDDSPAGKFDELVVISGTVWNPPTSCAWAAKVLVNSEKACIHGRKDVGLPSEVAKFTKRVASLAVTKKNGFGGFFQKMGMAGKENKGMEIQLKEMNNHTSWDICSINLSAAESQDNKKKWMCPMIKMSLPSFSGCTEYYPDLLKYSCQIECRLRAVAAVEVAGPSLLVEDGNSESDNLRRLSISIMLSKPILALEFNSLQMMVDAPSNVHQQ